MDPQIVTMLVGLAGVTVLPLATFGTNLLIKRATEAANKADLARLGVQKSSMEICQKNVRTAIFATQQHFKKFPDAANEDKKSYGMELLATLNEESGTIMSEATMSALIDEGIWDKNNPVAPVPDASLPPASTLDTSLPPKGMG